MAVFALAAALLAAQGATSCAPDVALCGSEEAAGNFSSALLGEEGPWEALWLEGYVEGVSGEFAQEVMDPQGYQAFSTQDGHTVGVVFPCNAESATEQVRRAMGDRGWVCVESGSEALLTFAKDQGRIRWTALSVTQTGVVSTAVFVMNDEGEQ